MVLILCGKSGCGKDAILKAFVERGFSPIVSTTSRPIRENETDGVEYNFITRGQFEELIKADAFVEYREYSTLVGGVPDVWLYGIPKMDLDEREKYVVILDIKGANELISHFGKDSCFVAYVTTPDSIRMERAKLRGSFDESEWNRRAKADDYDFRDEVVKPLADAVIDNSGSLEDTVDEIEDYFTIRRIESCI